MIGILDFSSFIVAGIILNLIPGADTMYILGRSVSQGKMAGLMSALGIASGALIHCIFAALGLSAILAQSAIAFEIVKFLGVVYLIYLGLKMLLSKSDDQFALSEGEEQVNLRKIYFSGILTNVLNPKVALFFLSFLPQFIDPAYAHSPIPFLILGMTFVITGTVWCVLLALFSSNLSLQIRKNFKFKKWLDRTAGGLFIYLGIKLAFQKIDQ